MRRIGSRVRRPRGRRRCCFPCRRPTRCSCSPRAANTRCTSGGLQLFQPPDGMDALDVRDHARRGAAPGRQSPRSSQAGPALDHLAGAVGLGAGRRVRPRAPRAAQRPAAARPRPRAARTVLPAAFHAARPAPAAVGDAPDRRASTTAATRSTPRPTTRCIDGVSALRMLSRMLTDDPDERGMPAPWAPRAATARASSGDRSRQGRIRCKRRLDLVGEAAGLVPALARTLNCAA